MPYPLFVRPVRVPAYSGFPVSVCTNSLIAIFIMQNLRFHTGRLGMILTPWNGFMLVSSERQQRRYMKPPFCFWVCLEQNYLVAKEVWREHFNLKRCRISLNGRLLKWVLPTYTLPFPFVPNMVKRQASRWCNQLVNTNNSRAIIIFHSLQEIWNLWTLIL